MTPELKKAIQEEAERRYPELITTNSNGQRKQRLNQRIFIEGATLYADNLEEKDKEIETLKVVIEKAHYTGYSDGAYTGKHKYNSNESFQLFKSNNNL